MDIHDDIGEETLGNDFGIRGNHHVLALNHTTHSCQLQKETIEISNQYDLTNITLADITTGS